MPGVSLEVLKELMGHHSIALTLRYAQLHDTTEKAPISDSMAENRPAVNCQREVTMTPDLITPFCAYRAGPYPGMHRMV